MVRQSYARIGRIEERYKMSEDTNYIKLICHPDRKMLEEEFSMVVERAQARGVERRLIADTLYWLLRKYMNPTTATSETMLEWCNQLRCYYTEIGNTLDIVEQFMDFPSTIKPRTKDTPLD
jgi:predicted  nucleic acid-binding Zn ribbon protein